MSRHSSTLTLLMSIATLGLLLAVAPGCTHGRGFYGFHWSYCKFFGYPKLLNCIAPPSSDILVLPEVQPHPGNPDSADKVELGKLLFFDTRLSSTDTVSCASCHVPKKAFADPPNRLSRGINGLEGRRNAPTVLNTAFHRFLFWDGRAESLEEQAEGPITNDKEMGPADNFAAAVRRLKGDAEMTARFKNTFGPSGITTENVKKALAAFERSLVLSKTAFERWVKEEEPMPSWSAERGWTVFNGKAQCTLCHALPLYHDNNFHNIGIRRHPGDKPDLGRYEHLRSLAGHGKPINPQEADSSKCAFKTPSLLHVADTPPYMHNGTLETLEDVVAFYTRFDPRASYARSDSQADDPECGKPDQRLAPIRGMLTPEEQLDLVEFLRSLSPAAGVYREFLDSLHLPSGH